MMRAASGGITGPGDENAGGGGSAHIKVMC